MSDAVNTAIYKDENYLRKDAWMLDGLRSVNVKHREYVKGGS